MWKNISCAATSVFATRVRKWGLAEKHSESKVQLMNRECDIEVQDQTVMCIYIYVCICMYVCIYIYIYIHLHCKPINPEPVKLR